MTIYRNTAAVWKWIWQKQKLCYWLVAGEDDVEPHAVRYIRVPMQSVVRVTLCPGRAIAQAVSRRFPTAASRVRSYGICGGQSGSGAGFLRGLRFPLPIRIPPIAPQPSSIICGWYNRPNCGRSTKWTQSHPMREKKTLCHTTTKLRSPNAGFHLCPGTWLITEEESWSFFY
jgi:hypothetical protein